MLLRSGTKNESGEDLAVLAPNDLNFLNGLNALNCFFIARQRRAAVMARIKHIAIRTGDVEKTAAFYKEAFGLKQVGLGQNGIYLTDGHLNIAVLKFQPGKNGEPLRLGIDHVGFQVDDVDATIARINGLGGKPLTDRTEVHPSDPSRPQSYYEIKCVGPDEQVIDVSNVGWVGTD